MGPVRARLDYECLPINLGGSRLEVGQVGWGVPLPEELHIQDSTSELFWEDHQDVVDARGGRRADRLEAMFVGGLTDLLSEPVVLSDEVG